MSANGTMGANARRAETGDNREAYAGIGGQVEALREEASRAYEAAAGETRRLGAYAREHAGVLAKRQKSTLARTIAEFGRNIRSASDELAEHPNISAFVGQAADRMEEVAGSLERKTTGEIYDDAEEFCRRNPVAVAAGAVLVGTLVSRAIKSSSRS